MSTSVSSFSFVFFLYYANEVKRDKTLTGLRLLQYILGTFIIGLLVSSSDPRLNLDTATAASSPFVIAMTDSGIKVLPSIINACLLTSAWSAASSDLYTSSRALYGLAVNGNAPAFL